MVCQPKTYFLFILILHYSLCSRMGTQCTLNAEKDCICFSCWSLVCLENDRNWNMNWVYHIRAKPFAFFITAILPKRRKCNRKIENLFEYNSICLLESAFNIRVHWRALKMQKICMSKANKTQKLNGHAYLRSPYTQFI